VIDPGPDKDSRAAALIDSREQTVWRSGREGTLPVAVVVDLGETLELSGFTYLPTQQRYIDGTVSEYKFYVSQDGRHWGEPVSQGEFSNIRNNPVLQTKAFDVTGGRFIKFEADREINDQGFVSIAELGIITSQ
jgi:alpha-L-fucosidase